MRYITNGQSYSEHSGSHPPTGCRFISEQEYYDAIQTDNAGYEQRARDLRARVLEVRAAAKMKLMSGKPLTEEEAEVVLG